MVAGSIAQRFINYPYLAKRDPLLGNLRTDPRFSELMGEVKPRWQALMQTAAVESQR